MSKTSSNKVLLNSIIYTCSGLLQKCFSFFLLPLYTVYLTTEDYGINSIAGSFLTTTSFIVSFSLFSAIMRFYVDLKDDPERLKRFYGSISLFVLLSGVVWIGIFYIFRAPLCKYVFSGVDFFPIVFVCLISLVFNCQHTIYDNIMRSQQKALKSSLFSIAYFLLTVTLNIIFVVGFQLGVLGILLATAISSFLYTVYFVIEMSTKKTITFCLDWALLKQALKYSVPIMPHNLSTHIAVLVSNVFIGGVNTLSTLGVYSVATQFGNIADTIQTYADSAYGPWLYENLKNKEDAYKKTIRKTVNFIISVIGLFFIGISLFAHDYIVLLVDPDYIGAWRFVPWIVGVFAIKTIYYFYVQILFYYKKASRKLFIATLSGSLINVLLSAIIIPIYGVYGSILADAIAMLIRVSIIVIISKKYDDAGLRIRDFILNFLVVMSFIFVGLGLTYLKYGNTFSWVNFLYKIAVVVVYLVYLLIRYRSSILVFYKSIRSHKGK